VGGVSAQRTAWAARPEAAAAQPGSRRAATTPLPTRPTPPTAPPPPTANLQAPLPPWDGPTLQQALRQRSFKADTLRLLPQAAPPRPPGPGGAEWGAGKDMAQGVKLNSRRTGFEYERLYGRCGGSGARGRRGGDCGGAGVRGRSWGVDAAGGGALCGAASERCGAQPVHPPPSPNLQCLRPPANVGSADRPPLNVEDASDDLPNDPLFRNADERALRLAAPRSAAGGGGAAADAGGVSSGASGGGGSEGGVGGLSAALMREGAARRQQDAAAAAAAGGGRGRPGGGERKAVLDVVKLFAGESLLYYNGTGVGGWYTRPQVRERRRGGGEWGMGGVALCSAEWVRRQSSQVPVLTAGRTPAPTGHQHRVSAADRHDPRARTRRRGRRGGRGGRARRRHAAAAGARA
jgi:translation initiation factor IF-2